MCGRFLAQIPHEWKTLINEVEGGTGKDPRNSTRDGGRHGNFVDGMAPIVPVMKQEDRVLMGDGLR